MFRNDEKVERARRCQERALEMKAFKLRLQAHHTRTTCAKKRLALAERIYGDEMRKARLELLSALEEPMPEVPALDLELNHSAVPTSSAASM